MKFLRYWLPAVMALCFATATIHAAPVARQQDRTDFDEELNDRDFDALRKFIITKRTIDTEEKATNLTISGDVRTEWRHLSEKRKGKLLRGGNATSNKNANFPCGIPYSRNDFDVEFNLNFDYVCEHAWAVAQLQFDNSCGVDDNGRTCSARDPKNYRDPEGYHGSGTRRDVNLKKAYWGYNICCECGVRFDIEVGRRPLYNIFDSRIQFLSRFDGILLKYSSTYEGFGKWYWNTGAFVVDERVNHFAYVTETGLLDICETGIDFKYSLIHWNKYGKNRCWVHNPEGFKFLNSQFTLAYSFEPEMLAMPAQVFGAFLINHEATSRHYQNIGWYVGFKVGKVVKRGDWAFEAQYQFAGARACPDNDFSGIGCGSVEDRSFTEFNFREVVDAEGNITLVKHKPHKGNGNFKGFRFEGLYALTDNLTIQSVLDIARAAANSYGGRHRYSKFEIEAIYAF